MLRLISRLCLGVGCGLWLQPAEAGHKGPINTPPAQRTRVVVVKPVILCDDDGGQPARSEFPKKRVDQVYSSADLEFLYQEPVHWSYGAARRGEINLDQIVKEGREQKIICEDPHIVTLLFVSAVDGKPGPLGRGMQGGNVCFVALGPKGVPREPGMFDFVVAHEIGHCLGLIHAVDDPAVPDDVPNLQGNGPFEERLAVAGLHPTQRDTVLKSPLVLDRVKCYSAAEARAVLRDLTWDDALDGATDDILRFDLGLGRGEKLEREPGARLAWALQRQAAMAENFTDDESAMLQRLVTGARERISADWPMLERLPWHFIKVKNRMCKGMAHTRGLVTVLSENALWLLSQGGVDAVSLLVHEKIHVLQRLNPGRFTNLYKEYGYVPVRLANGEAGRLNLIHNPDAPVNDWAVALPDSRVLIATSYGFGGSSFTEKYYELQSAADGTSRIGAEIGDKQQIDRWRQRFPIRIGYDHPHEVFAYLTAGMLESKMRRDPPAAPNAILDATRRALPAIFRVDGD